MHSLVYPAIPVALGGIAPNQQGFEHFSIDSNAIENTIWLLWAILIFAPSTKGSCKWAAHVISSRKIQEVYLRGHQAK